MSVSIFMNGYAFSRSSDPRASLTELANHMAAAVHNSYPNGREK